MTARTKAGILSRVWLGIYQPDFDHVVDTARKVLLNTLYVGISQACYKLPCVRVSPHENEAKSPEECLTEAAECDRLAGLARSEAARRSHDSLRRCMAPSSGRKPNSILSINRRFSAAQKVTAALRPPHPSPDVGNRPRGLPPGSLGHHIPKPLSLPRTDALRRTLQGLFHGRERINGLRPPHIISIPMANRMKAVRRVTGFLDAFRGSYSPGSADCGRRHQAISQSGLRAPRQW
jgi:hypothetical protein